MAKTADDVSRSRPREDKADLGTPGNQEEDDCSLGYEMLMSSIGGKPLTRIARITQVLWAWWSRITVKTDEEEEMHYDKDHMHHEFIP